MVIIHYTLGLYPKRTGGLNRYVTDLIREQSKENDVSALVPGVWKPWLKTCRISKCKKVNKIKCYELANAIPQPLLYGIKKPCDFIIQPINEISFEKFYLDVMPNVIHLHTLMGFPEEALSFFKKKGVKIVYTSHDYFGICPKVNLINQNGELCQGPFSERCEMCNTHAPSTLYLRLRSSKITFAIRDFVRWLKNTINF